ncbi:MAG TPA: hypothetical protein VJI69_04050, partial [Bacteroidia bacterium]|nr:hypothetical protein [Bacteroidia bacterium]
MLLKKNSLVLKGALFVAASMIFVACGSDAPTDDTITPPTEDSVANEVQTEEVTYSLPSPLQIASIFKKSGLKYKAGVTSDLRDPAKYTSNLNKAINLGVYSADLSYAVLNKQNQEAMTYMKLSRQFADNLGMGTVFDQGNLSTRFEK